MRSGGWRTLALLAFGTLPWLRGIVSSITWPGGPSISLWERRERLTAREERAASDAVQAIGTAATGAGGERLRAIFQLAGQYETLRRETPSGDQRTGEMGALARQMLGLLPIAELDVPAELLSPRAGHRLAAYLAVLSAPSPTHGRELVETLTEREGIPYNQSWALRAVSRIIDEHGPGWVGARSAAVLAGMRDGLAPGSYRQVMLANLVDEISYPA